MKKTIFVSLCALVLSAALLFALQAATRSAAQAAAKEELALVQATLLPGATGFSEEPVDGQGEILSAWKADNGYVITVRQAGYAGDILLMVGVTNDGSVTGLTIRQMEETYGLGMQALTDHVFLQQFIGTSGDAAVGQQVDAISGATVTSKAIARGVNAAVAFVTGADTATEATSWGG